MKQFIKQFVTILLLLFLFHSCHKTPLNNSTVGCLNPLAFNYNQYADTEGECFFSDEKIYVSAQGYDQVNILNVVDGEINTTQNIISVNFTENIMDTPHYIVIDEQDSIWFVSLINSGMVMMYSLENNTLLDSIFVGDSPALMTHDSNDNKLYVSRMMPMNGMMGMVGGASNTIQVLDYGNKTFTKYKEFELPAPSPHGIDISDSGDFLYVASNTSDWIYKIDTQTGNILNETFIVDPNNPNPVPPEVEINYYKPIHLKYFNQKIFITCSAGKYYNGQTEENINGMVLVLNEDDLQIISQYDFEWYSSPWHMAINENNGDIFISLAGDNGFTGSSGIACLSFDNSNFTHKWTSTGLEFSTSHGVSISKKYSNVYLSGRGNGILYSINMNNGVIEQAVNILQSQTEIHTNHHNENHTSSAMLGGIVVF